MNDRIFIDPKIRHGKPVVMFVTDERTEHCQGKE